MIEATIAVPTADGVMPTWTVRPDETGPFPLVIFLMDALGVREELRDMSRRIASVGYAVQLPNLFYRDGGSSFDPGTLASGWLDPKMLALNKQVMLSVDTNLDKPEARRVTFFTGRNNIFYLEMAIDRTEFIKLNDFESHEAPDPDELIAQVNAQSAAAPQQASSDEQDDFLKSLGM